jgi:NADPH:quinone reductase-like Zn-dependent oxidoreductase/acyl carrier protein
MDYRFGLECAGLVSAVGEDVTGFQVGDAVMAIGQACIAHYATVSAELTHPIPDGLTFEQAVSIPVAFTTAQDCLTSIAALRPGERVLIHAVTGGVGQAAVQLAARTGAEVFGTAGTEAKRAYARTLGVARVMDSRAITFADECVEAGGVDVVLNSLAGEFIAAGLRCLRPRGRFVELGRRDIVGGTLLDMSLLAPGLILGSYYPDPASAEFAAAFRDVAKLAEMGEITPLPVQVFDKREAAQAFSLMSRAQHVGKVVISFAPESKQTAGHVAGIAARYETITPDIGVKALLRALAGSASHLLVTRRDLSAEDDEMVVAEHVLEQTVSAPAHARPELEYCYIPLKGDIEQGLGAIWAGLLSIDRVGAEDRFLDLGGDSLYATQMVARVRRQFGVRIAPASVLGSVTLREVAEQIKQLARDGGDGR